MVNSSVDVINEYKTLAWNLELKSEKMFSARCGFVRGKFRSNFLIYSSFNVNRVCVFLREYVYDSDVEMKLPMILDWIAGIKSTRKVTGTLYSRTLIRNLASGKTNITFKFFFLVFCLIRNMVTFCIFLRSNFAVRFAMYMTAVWREYANDNESMNDKTVYVLSKKKKSSCHRLILYNTNSWRHISANGDRNPNWLWRI